MKNFENKIATLEVMTEDLGKMTWYEAKKACADLGGGWRLPTKEGELESQRATFV